MEPSSFSGSWKPAKATSNFPQVARCLVDGCNADLSLCRDYHRRHKVCETHSKTPKVTIHGREQRFCQQCSRFHSLSEFDQGKRSCRKRLDCHNRRRRKLQPEYMPQTSSFFIANQPSSSGTIISFGSSLVMPTSVVPSAWPGRPKAESGMPMLYGNNQLQQQVPFDERPEPEPDSFLKPYHSLTGLNHHQLQFHESAPSMKFSPEGVNHHQAIVSDGALSLLSSAAPQSTTPKASSSFSLSYSDRIEAPSCTQPLAYGFNLDGFNPFDRDPASIVSSAQYQDDGNPQFADMLHHGGEGPSSCGSRQTLSFMWE